MTYLEVVNTVLKLMRLDEVATVAGQEDEAVKVVIQNVNDAKKKVENAWRWNVLRDEWAIPVVQGVSTYPITDSYDQIIIDDVLLNDQWVLKPNNKKSLDRKLNTYSTETNAPNEYAIAGANANREVLIKFWPLSNQSHTVTITGWKNQPDLAIDSDELLVPHYPVVYEALAMSARERGEVGGQTSLELFGMAKKYLEDAIALDASMSPLDTNWYTI